MVYSCEVISLAQRHEFAAGLGFTITSPIAPTVVTVSVPFADSGNGNFVESRMCISTLYRVTELLTGKILDWR
jgi:hypothetical protein